MLRFDTKYHQLRQGVHEIGRHQGHPRGGRKHKTFTNRIRAWTRMYDALGGESLTSVANSSGIQADLLSKWLKIYREAGLNGLKSSIRKGRRPSKMPNKPKPPDWPKTAEELERENEYLKKLSALVQGRKGLSKDGISIPVKADGITYTEPKRISDLE